MVLHVWIWTLDVGRRCLSQHEDRLCAEEWRRVRRYTSQQLARRFIVRRGMLRRILGQYLDQPPQEIRFVHNLYGKPFLDPVLASELHFNLSDSGELAALAICLGQPVGIDIERLRPIPVVEGLQSYDLTPRELELFELVPEPERSLRFFQSWTRREAIAKAEGVGLRLLSGRLELDDLALCQVPASNEVNSLGIRGFHLHHLALPDGYVGFLATRQKLLEICYYSPDRP